MRIGYVYPFKAYPARGGNHVHALELIRGFQEAGHSVVTLDDPTPPGVESYDSQTRTNNFLKSIEILYVRIDGNHSRDLGSIGNVIRSSEVPMVWEINAPANENLAFSWLGGDRWAPTTRFGRVVDHARRAAHASRQLPGIWLEERLRRQMATHVNAAICVSEPLANYARNLGIPRVEVLPNGADPTVNYPGRTPIELPDWCSGRFKVLYAGSPVYPWQGFNVISAVVELSRQQQQDILFMLLVNQRTAGIPSGSDVLVFEGVSHGEVGAYICSADVCVGIHPEYHWSKWGFHGSSMKVFEYMACARPVVASDVGQLREVVGATGSGIVCENAPPAVLNALLHLRERPDERARMGDNGRRAVLERYNWRTIAARTLDIFRDVLEDTGRVIG